MLLRNRFWYWLVMFFNRSHGCTTQVSGENAIPFQHGRIREVLVQHGLNTVIGMGGDRCDLYQFELKWYDVSRITSEDIKIFYDQYAQVESPRHARTMEETPTEPFSPWKTPRLPQLEMRYVPGQDLALHERKSKFSTVIPLPQPAPVPQAQVPSPRQLELRKRTREELLSRVPSTIEMLINHNHLADFRSSTPKQPMHEFPVWANRKNKGVVASGCCS